MNATGHPLITIGMTSFNAAVTIAAAVQSALVQDWPNFEIVIVDDGSTDDSVAVIRQAIAGEARARLIVHPENKGFAGALNTLIAAAQGEYLAIFDDDDTSVSHRLTQQYRRLRDYEDKHPGTLIVCHAARLQRFENGYERYEKTMGTEGYDPAPHGRDVADRILLGRLSPDCVGSCANCSRMARIGVYRTMNGFDSTLRRAEDTDFNIRLGLAGGHFVGIAEPLVIQTMTTGREKTLDAEYRASLLLLEKHRAYLESIGWYSFCRTWLDLRFDHMRGQTGKLLSGIACLFIRHPIKVALKLVWSLPARSTRQDMKKWYRMAFNTPGGARS